MQACNVENLGLEGSQAENNSRGQVVIESKDDARKRGVKSPDRAEAIILAFAELGLDHGLFEYWHLEYERLKAATGVVSPPGVCPQCGNVNLALYYEAWRCNVCCAAGTFGGEPIPKCPHCEATAVTQRGAEWHCNNCGEQFRS